MSFSSSSNKFTNVSHLTYSIKKIEFRVRMNWNSMKCKMWVAKSENERTHTVKRSNNIDFVVISPPSRHTTFFFCCCCYCMSSVSVCSLSFVRSSIPFIKYADNTSAFFIQIFVFPHRQSWAISYRLSAISFALPSLWWVKEKKPIQHPSRPI